MATITDLTNTSWYVPRGWSAEAGYGKFDISYDFDLNYEYYNFHKFDIGYHYIGNDPSYDDFQKNEVPKDNCIQCYGITFPMYDSFESFNISIIDGADVTNQKLIAWLQTYGKQLKVTDLTNTTWNVKAGWEAESAFLSFGRYQESVGILNGKDIYDLKIGYGTSTEEAAPYDSIEPVANSITYHAYNYSNPHISMNNTEELLFVFGNSTIANDLYTNPKLIAWLSEYGELQEEKITDLTGYTVTVPSEWAATAGYGRFSIDWALATDPNTVSGDFDIGYFLDYADGSLDPKDNYIVSGYSGLIELNNSIGFTINIEKGTDASNPNLIQWFVDNDATFEKTGEDPDTPEEDVTSTATITYDGATVTLKEGQTITFRFAEKVFKSDIVIRNAVKQKETFNFYIDLDGIEDSIPKNEIFTAEEGMTWGSWGSSSYSDGVTVGSCGCSPAHVIINGNYYVSGGGSDIEWLESEISANTSYTLTTAHAGKE